MEKEIKENVLIKNEPTIGVKEEPTHPAALLRKYGKSRAPAAQMTQFQRFVFVWMPGISLTGAFLFAHYMVYEYVTSDEYLEDLTDHPRKPIIDEIKYMKRISDQYMNYVGGGFDKIKRLFSREQ